MPTRRMTSILFVALAACAPLSAQPSGCPQGSPSVSPTVGTICGKSSSIPIPQVGTFTANAYLGIPYAQPPVGNLRWQNPVAPNSWTTPFQAIQFRNECPQPKGLTFTSSGTCNLGPNQSEDCLYLNVWTPTGAASSSKLPVLVFIHGGAFFEGTGGSNTSDLFDGTYLAASQNVVVVTFNYRLGALGFLATSDMPGGGGNFGFRDQLMALNWVQKNIASFGGDPSQVMLFGQSAGAMSVGLHALSSSQSASLFKAALMESNPLGLPYKTLLQAQTLGTTYSNLFNCPGSKCLQQLSACELVAQESSPCLKPTNVFAPTATLLSSFLNWTPVIDGILITGQPMDNAANLKVPMLMGTNLDEGIFFANQPANPPATCPTPQPSVQSLTPSESYAALLDVLFGFKAAEIETQKRYSCPSSSISCTTPMANVITDYLFTCANRQLAASAGNAQNLYMYLFDQVTSFNTVPTTPACQNYVCHGAELAYVFNTAWALQSPQTFQPAEETLSQTMGGYWASFAKNQSPGNAWPLFSPNKTYLKLDKNSSLAIDPLSTTANCTFWTNNIPYQNKELWTRLLAPVKAAPKKKPAH